MEAVLYICHGSRSKMACEEAVIFIKKCMGKCDIPIQEYCFLELAHPTIEKSYERLIQRGATKIVALPVLLLTADHAKKDIPSELAKVSARYPGVELVYGKPIGVHSKMIDILIERLQDTEESITDNNKVVIVGRGSSDPDVKRDLTQIAEMLQQKTGISSVEPCFLTAEKPSLMEMLELSSNSSNKKVFIIPYLLFTGFLMKSIEKTIRKVSEHSDKEFILCHYLGYHQNIAEVLLERIANVSASKGETIHVFNNS